MNEFIEINKENYSSVLPVDVVAFHYASPGACGYPGHIRIITSDGRKVRVDYTDTPREIVSRICPPLESIAQASTNNLPMPIGWLRLNMVNCAEKFLLQGWRLPRSIDDGIR